MKKRLFTLVLAAVLCLGLVVPALAADASSLDAKTAQAYADVLNAQIQQYGIADSSRATGVHYADLIDMDANGIAELIVISCLLNNDSSNNYQDNLQIGVWTMKNGAAIQTVNEEVEAPGKSWTSSVWIVSDGQETAIYYGCGSVSFNASTFLYKADGSVERYESEWIDEIGAHREPDALKSWIKDNG